ncbi:hypothetical protein [Kineococcus radiotolerans]|nr:hypothetical protein [Kineococcus radiotolerans]
MPTFSRPLRTALSSAVAALTLTAVAATPALATGTTSTVRTLTTTTTSSTVAAPATDPVLVNPVVWKPSPTWNVFTAPADRDVLVDWPETPLDVAGGFTLIGGRNVISTGGTVNFSKEYHVTGEAAKDNRCLYIAGNAKAQAARTIVLDGFHCAGSNVYEGINFDSKAERTTLTLRMRNILIDGVKTHLGAVMGQHDGGDAFQTWSGPAKLEVNGFTANNLDYQGFYLQPFSRGQGALGQWNLANVTLNGSRTGHAYLLWLAGTRNGTTSTSVRITVQNFRINTAPNLSWKAVWNKSQWPDLTVTQGLSY